MGQQHATPSRIALRPSDVPPTQLFRTPGQSQTDLEHLEEPAGELVPVMFKWTHGGQRVALTGTFNNWASMGIPMVRSGQEFYQVVEIPKGVHEYKFLVDGEWKFSLDQPVLEDAGGNVNNVVDIQYYEKYEPTPLRDPINPVEDEGDCFATDILDPNQSEPSSAPPLLMKLAQLGIATDSSRSQQPLFLDSAPSVIPNIPLFSICGHLISEQDMVATTIRFAQKYSSTILVRSGSGKGLKPLSKSPDSKPEGILRRANSSGSEGRSKALDMSSFTD